MGICLSVTSPPDTLKPKQHHEQHVGLGGLGGEEETLSCNKISRLASFYSQQGNKGPNQDAAVIFQGFGKEDGVFCGVFDGHGKHGHNASKFVRNCLPSLLLAQRNSPTSLNTLTGIDDYEEKLETELDSTNTTLDEWRKASLSAFKLMDKELKLQEHLDCSFSGTTAVTIIKQGQDLVISNLGDSRAILGTISENGELRADQLTVDLKPGLPKEMERIRKSNGRVFALKDEPHIQRVWLPNNDFPGLAMARSFGDFLLKNYGIISIPQISYRRLNNKDQFLVLATDGVWDVLSNNQVAAIVWSAENEEKAAKAVVDAAVDTWKRKYPSTKMDDCTVVCLFLQGKQQWHQMQ